MRHYYKRFPDVGYGQKFEDWAKSSQPRPYRSYGNGSAMRVSPIGFASKTLKEALTEAKRSAQVTHNHRHGIKGAQAVAAAIFMAKNNHSKLEIKDFEDAIRKAISLGGDSDTIACITGGIAQAYYKELPSELVSQVMLKLDSGFRKVIREFNGKYGIG